MFSFRKKQKQGNALVGVTLSAEGIAVAAVSQDSGQIPQLLGCVFTPLDNEAESVQALQQTLKRLKVEDLPVTTIMQRGEFSLQMTEAPDVASDELKSAIKWKVKDILDYDINAAVIDVFEIPGQKERGRAPMVYVVAARKENVQQRIDKIEASEAELRYIDIPELVLRNIAMLLPEDETGVAILHFEANDGLITLTRQEALYLAREIDIGYQALQVKPLHSEEPVEGMSLETGMALEGVAPDQQRALDNVILEVQRSLDYYESHFAMPITSLVIAPLVEEIPGMVSYIASNLGIPVRILDLAAVMDMPEPISKEQQARCFMAIGAALRKN